MAGGRVVPVPLALEKGEWRFDFEALARRATRKSKLLVMSNGGNPSGIVYSRAGARADRRPGPAARPLGVLGRGVREDAPGRDDALQHRVLARHEGADRDGLLLLEGVRHDRVPDRLRGRPRQGHRSHAQHPPLLPPGLLGGRAARGPCRAHRRHGALAPRQHRQPGAQARLPRRPAQPDPGDPLQHAEGLLLHLPRRAGAGAAHVPAGGAPPAARPRRRRAGLRVRPEGRGPHPRELLLQPWSRSPKA